MAGLGFSNVGFVGSLSGGAVVVPPAAANLFKNGSFDQPATGNTATGWNAQGTASIANGALSVNGNNDTTQAVTFVNGAMYRLTCTLRSASVGFVQILTNSGQNGQLNGSSTETTLNGGMLTATVDFAAATNSELYFIRGQGGTNALVESISITALP